MAGRATHNGKIAEAKVRKICERYLKDGLAFIEQYPARVAIRAVAGGQAIGHVSDGPVDFTGPLAPLARTCGFDVKSTDNKTSFPLSNIKGHQIKWLQNLRRMNGLPFLLVNFRLLDLWYLVPVSNIEQAWDDHQNKLGAPASLKLEWFGRNAYPVPLEGRGKLPHFLEAIGEWQA